MNKTNKLEYYLGLKYPVTLVPEAEGYSVAILDLPGCLSQGETPEEALANIEDAKRGWLEVAIEEGIEIPEPDNEREYSGKFVIRTPKSLHRLLTINAKKENVSLNQYVNLLLATGVKRQESEKHLEEIKEILSQTAPQPVNWDMTSDIYEPTLNINPKVNEHRAYAT